MIKPKFCEKGFYNFNIKSYFQENKLSISNSSYYDAKYKYANLSLVSGQKQKCQKELISHDIWLTNPQNPR